MLSSKCGPRHTLPSTTKHYLAVAAARRCRLPGAPAAGCFGSPSLRTREWPLWVIYLSGAEINFGMTISYDQGCVPDFVIPALHKKLFRQTARKTPTVIAARGRRLRSNDVGAL